MKTPFWAPQSAISPPTGRLVPPLFNQRNMVSKTKMSAKYRQDVANLAVAQSLTASRSRVFIAFDVKWDEDDPDTVLEIGMAILDLRHGFLRPNRLPPSTWSIRPHHIIISDNMHIHNTRYSRSNKFGFKFGKSYIARLEKAVKSINDILNRYPTDQIVIVGQFISKDKAKLEDMGIEIDDDMLVFDISNLERAYEQQVNGRRRSLREICENLEVPYYRRDKLGNAGNDAFFAMACFSEMCC